MTERKPTGTSWKSWIEAQIRVATEEGAFDNLPGAVSPSRISVRNTTRCWWQKQLVRARADLHTAAIARAAPQGGDGARHDREAPDEATVRRRVAALNVEIAKVNATVVEGPPTRLGTLDVDQVVAQWRRTRSANPR